METNSQTQLPVQQKPVTLKTKICYGLGHVLNDCCAAIWFSYMLFFLQIIVTLDPATAGLYLMIGMYITINNKNMNESCF